MGSLLHGLVIGLGFVMLVGGFAVIALNYRPYRIPTDSMTPTVQPGDTVLAHTVSGGAVGRGDIVIFRDSQWGGEVMVKRVVAVGGDTVACCDSQGRLLVNGKPIDEPYTAPQVMPGKDFKTTVPSGRLFLLGDSRVNSLDSRAHLDVASGTVPASDVTARVEATVWPYGRVGVVKRTVAFDGLGAPTAAEPGSIAPATYATVGGAAVVVLASAAGGVVSLGRRLRCGSS
ncbi:signal peptidase I [Kitasatospora sp. GP82]|uniref:signal peptidase I n=1 Tax=Kitasatospora sp. GP82 TaxID=3035089 RepID=UPI002474AB39|nr:signal peptidase I [Kitasatospora sp. GP82]MDH6129179.1 signal peptidase I [Kitasatospora sp. GP82]